MHREGTKGISMFIVPKMLVNDDGSLGERNDVYCAGIEHKMGINAQPDLHAQLRREAVRAPIGYLVGEANRGLEYMFVMMNAARFSVGVQGLAIADRAYQSALAYAKERVQCRDVGMRDRRKPVAIIQHPDVRRMLMSMKVADRSDARARVRHRRFARLLAHKPPDEAVRKEHKAFVELMIPIVKGWCTETAHRNLFDRPASLRRHGLHRRDGDRAAVPRRADHVDL